VYEPWRIAAHNWASYDLALFVSAHMKDAFVRAVGEPQRPREMRVLHNSIDLDLWPFEQRAPGFNIGAIASMTFRKNPFKMADLMSRLVRRDPRYTLKIVGPVEEGDCLEAFQYQCGRLNLGNHVTYEGRVDHSRIGAWLADKQYVLSTSVHEGHPVGLSEAMACGVKPIIYDYPGACEVFPRSLLFQHLEEAEALILSSDYDSRAYRDWIASRFSSDIQWESIKGDLARLAGAGRKASLPMFGLSVMKTSWYRGADRLRRLLDN
jgi:glycosyltransferase involved in cell wall biosynthesis